MVATYLGMVPSLPLLLFSLGAVALASDPNYTVSEWHAGTRCEEGDVNALFSYRGRWHLMHQFRDRPRTSIGHQASSDLLHWRRLSDALESGNATNQQCYDGGVSLVPHPGGGGMQPLLMIDGGCARLNVSGSFCMESTGQNTGGVTAFPADPSDPDLTTWVRQGTGPTEWLPCNGSAWPSPIWQNPITEKWELTAVRGNDQARFEAADASFTKWVQKDPTFFTGIKGLGGGQWHKMPPNVAGVSGKPWATHVFQGALGTAFNGLPNFVMGVYDPAKETFTNISAPMLLDGGGGVNYGQLSWQDSSDNRVLFVSWLRLTEPAPPDCGTAGQLSAIRDLRYDPRLDRLVHEPIAEYTALRDTASPLFQVSSQKLVAGQAAPAVLFSGGGDGGNSCGAATGLGCGISMDATFSVSVPATLGAGGASAVIAVRCSDAATCKGGAKITLAVSGGSGVGGSMRTVTMHVDYQYHITQTFTLLPGEAVVPLRVMSDRRSLEVFAGPNGRAAISITMLSPGGMVTAAATGADLDLDAAGWTMKSIH